MYGLKVFGEKGFVQYSSDEPVFSLKSIKSTRLQGGIEGGHSWSGTGKKAKIAMPKDCQMVAVYSNSWVMMSYINNEVNLMQEYKGGAGDAKVFGFANDVNTSTERYGLEMYGANGLMALSGKSLLKVIDAFTLPNNIQNWSYNAPTGRAIAAMVGGGYGRWSWADRNFVDHFYRMLFRMPTMSRIEISLRKIAENSSPRLPIEGDRKFDYYQRIPLSVAIIDITDILHFNDF